MRTKPEATIDDLRKVESKAEIVNGELVLMPLTGAAGTLVVWDVDVLRARGVRVYRASNPDAPTVYRSGDLAEAEPAVPGWTMPVDELLPPE